MNLRMTDRAVAVARIRKIVGNLCRAGEIFSGQRAGVAVALDTKLSHATALEQLGIRRAVWVVTGGAAFDLERRMFEDERALFVRVALEAGGVRPRSQPYLLQLEAAMRVMTIAAIHRAFQDFVMEGAVELRLGLVVTSHAEQHLVFFQHASRDEVTGVRRKGADRLQRG